MSETGLEAEAFEERVNAMKARAKEIARRVAKAAGYRGELMPGEIVRLKCGGPAMVIALFDVTSGLVHCQWIAGGRPYRASYWPELIMPAASDYMEVPPKKPGPFARRASAHAADDPDTAKSHECAGESGAEESPDAVKSPDSESESDVEDSRDGREALEALEEFEDQARDALSDTSPMIRKLRTDMARSHAGGARVQKRLGLPTEIRREINRVRSDTRPAKRRLTRRDRAGDPSQQK